MTFQRRLFAALTLTLLAIMVALAFFALPTQRRAAATTYFILTPTASFTPPPLTIGDTFDPSGQPRLPKLEGMAGRLLFTYRLNLYLAAFDGEPARQIATDVKPSAVHVAPDQQSLIYWVQRQDAIGQRLTIVNLVNLDTLATSTLMTFQGRVDLIRWSPDGAWVALDLQSGQGDDFESLGLLIAARTQPVPLNLVEDFTAAAWLDDNRLLISDPAATFAIYEPTTRAVTALDVPADQRATLQDIRSIYAAGYGDAVETLTALGLNPVWTPTYTFSPDLGVAPDASEWVAGETTPESTCRPFQIVRHTVADNSTTVLAEISERYTLRLSNFQWAVDDTLYFVRWSSQVCPADLGRSTAQLYRLAPDGGPVLLGGPLLTEVYLHTYAVAPDGGAVVWVGYEGRSSYLASTEIESGEQQALMSLETDSYPYGFTSVWWLPE